MPNGPAEQAGKAWMPQLRDGPAARVSKPGALGAAGERLALDELRDVDLAHGTRGPGTQVALHDVEHLVGDGCCPLEGRHLGRVLQRAQPPEERVGAVAAHHDVDAGQLAAQLREAQVRGA